ncbi:hypothetical protein Nmel_015547 [Mimus melanotis]
MSCLWEEIQRALLHFASVLRSFWLWSLGITENNQCASEMLHSSLQDCGDSHFPC